MYHFFGLHIQPIKSNPIPSTARGALGPAFIEKWNRLGFLTRSLPIPRSFKARRISDSLRTSDSPVKGPVMVEVFTSAHFGLVALKKAKSVTSNLNLIRVTLSRLP